MPTYLYEQFFRFFIGPRLSRARAPRRPSTIPHGSRLHNGKGTMTFSLAENLPFLALPLGLIIVKVCCPHHLHMSVFSVHFPLLPRFG